MAKAKASKKKVTKKPAAKKKVAKKAAAKKTTTKKAPAKKSVTKKAPARKKSVGTKKAAAKKPAAKRAVSKKAPAKKAKKKVTKKAVAKKAPAKKTAAKKAVAKKSVAIKPVAKKTVAKKRPAPAKKAPAAKPAAVAPRKKSRAAAKPVATRPAPVVPVRPKIVRKLVNLEDVKIAADYVPSDKEEYMCAEHLAYFKRKLENWRDELILESQETLEHLRTETRDVGDEAERASRESDNILELRTRDRYRKLLRKIEEALKRVEEGAYGFCEETGEEIGLGRLEARPIATLTVDAQERREMFQKQFRDDR